MQGKFEQFDELPEELKIEIAQSLSAPDLVNLAKTSKYHLSLFKPMIDVRTLLHHVVCANHDAVQLILKDDISLIFKRGFVTDCSGREFENISSFEYTVWALDTHMREKMISCIPHDEKGSKVFAQLIAQYNKVNIIGVTYSLNGETITENHYDFQINKELQMQVDSIRAPGGKDWDAIYNQWRKGVGGAQKLLPIHIIDEYCSNEPFYPVPKFTSRPKSSKQFYNLRTVQYENWFNIDSKLGSEIAIYKAVGLVRGAPRSGLAPSSAFDLDAMKALCEARTRDLINLKSQLEEQAGLDNHYQVVSM